MIPLELKEGFKNAFVIFLAFMVGNVATGPVSVVDIFVGTTLALGYFYGWWARTNHLNDKLQAEIDRRNKQAEEDAAYMEE